MKTILTKITAATFVAVALSATAANADRIMTWYAI